MVAFLFIGIIPLISLTTFTYLETSSSLQEEAMEKLTTVREMKAMQIEDYFQQTRDQVLTLSESTMVIEALVQFRKAFHRIDQELGISDAYSSQRYTL